jgi:large subunit ribosomal protein L28
MKVLKRFEYLNIFHIFATPKTMSRVCDLTGKKALKGNRVSHSNKKTKRRFYPNLQTKKFFIEETGEWITLKVTASTIKTIDKKGVSACLNNLFKRGKI